ncbi:MAG TPA: tRNA lysidine(34) synthetase TilS [Micromonosporaceae bacterium]
MAALAPAVAELRHAVRTATAGLTGPVLVACSGGADSLALAAAAAFVAPRAGWRAGLVTVDHQLQDGSAQRAQAVARWARGAGLDPVVVTTVRVDDGPGGPEAAARQARYDALVAAAREHDARHVLVGHTRDDQAETVLLALLRGGGLRGLAGMPAARDLGGVTLLRPLLGLSRARVRQAGQALGLRPWDDPHNVDPSFARTRARTLLMLLRQSLGPAVVGNLAQTARLAAADADLLDRLADDAATTALGPDGRLDCAALERLPAALATRVLHRWARSLGVPGSALSHRHVDALGALVWHWHGQGPVHLPGGVRVARRGGWLGVLAPVPAPVEGQPV